MRPKNYLQLITYIGNLNKTNLLKEMYNHAG